MRFAMYWCAYCHFNVKLLTCFITLICIVLLCFNTFLVLSMLHMFFLCYVVCFFVFVLCLEWPMFPVSLDCPFLIALFVFSNVYSKWVKNYKNLKQHCLINLLVLSCMIVKVLFGHQVKMEF